MGMTDPVGLLPRDDASGVPDSVQRDVERADYANSNTDGSPVVRPSVRWFRHRAQTPLLFLSTVLTVLFAVMVLYGVAVGVLSTLFLLVFLTPFVWYARDAVVYHRTVGSAVRVSLDQLPDVWRSVEVLYRKTGVRFHDVVVVNSSRIVPWHVSNGHRRVLVIPSSLVELGGVGRFPQATHFFLAREVGALADGQASFYRSLISCVGRLVPVLGATLSRSEEATRDAYGSVLSDAGVSTGFGALLAGKYVMAAVDVQEAVDSSQRPSIWLVLSTALSYRTPVLWRAGNALSRVGHPKPRFTVFYPAVPTR